MRTPGAVASAVVVSCLLALMSYVVVGAEAAAVPAVSKPGSPLLAFGGAGGIYLAGSDGRSFRRLIETSGSYPSDPAWSPDGKQLTYVDTQPSPCGCHFDIYIADIRGHTARRLTHEGRNTSPSWSPSGHLIAFSGTSAIYVIKPDGSGLRRITALGMNGIPVWSPDGTAIAFGWSGHGTYVVRLERQTISRASAIPTPFLSWSDDGRYLAITDISGYLCKAACGSKIDVVNVARMTTTQLIDGLQQAWDPVWTPTKGHRLAFVGQPMHGKKVGIYVMDPGHAPKRLGPYWISASATRWSPDGSAIAFRGTRTCSSGTCESIFTTRESGGRMVAISRGVDLQGSRFAWQPQ
jgi:TolB protein